MAGFTMRVQSAIFPFVCTLESGQPPCCLICGIPPCRACPYASKFISGEPNTPLAFRRWDECHLKQQAGHGKNHYRDWTVDEKSYISLVANDDIDFMHLVQSEEPDRTLTKL